MVEKYILNDLITLCEEELDKGVIIAHKEDFKLVFEGEQVVTQGMVDAIYAQGKKDALRLALVELKRIRGYN
tara:strand:+ start:4394 stop:4609 length:216 start_codon:yes stop_codon:yes gene_type:complete